jgi:hypothetical protein
MPINYEAAPAPGRIYGIISKEFFMNMFFRRAAAGTVLAAAVILPQLAQAQTTVGTIFACYYSAECTYSQTQVLTPPIDGPAFQFNNTGTLPITGAKLSIVASKKLSIAGDSFVLGTINPGASKVIIVGASNDKKTHASGSFFFFNGPSSPTDTSDNGVDADSIVFVFTGKVGTAKVKTKIVTGATAQPSKDGTVAKINFLGGPGNDDGPCQDCFASTQIGTIVTGAP